MSTYVWGCILTYIFTYLVFKVQKDKNKHQFIKILFAALPLIYIASVRYNVGMDYPVYKSRFISISYGRTIEEFEVLYHKLNEAVAYLGGDFRWFFAVTAIIFCVLVYKAIFRDSPLPALSAFLLVTTTYYFCFFNGIRSMLAYAITLYSLKYVEERKLIPFLITVLIAGGFHATAYVFVLVYFIYNVHLDNRIIIILSAVFFALAPFFGGVINRIVLATKYAHYLTSIFADMDYGYIKLLILIAVAVFAGFYADKEDKNFQLYYKLHIISLWLTFFVPYVPLISRLRWMFGLPMIILIPLALKKEKNEKIRLIIFYIIIILYSAYCIYNLIEYNTNQVLPYKTIFDRF